MHRCAAVGGGTGGTLVSHVEVREWAVVTPAEDESPSTGRWKIVVGPLAAVVVLVGVGIALLSAGGEGAEPGASTTSTTAGPADDDAETATSGEISMRVHGGATVVTGPTVTIELDLPEWVSSMRISADPTMSGATDVAPAASVEVAVPDAGYQMVFGHFTAVDGTVTRRVVGVEVDPTWDAAVASAVGAHRPSWVATVSPSIVAVRIEEGRVVWSDTAQEWELVGSALSPRTLDRVETYRVSGPDAAGAPTPVAVHRVSRPRSATTADGEIASPLVHDLYLVLDGRLEAGAAYRIDFADLDIDEATFTYDDRALTSPAVHVNTVGYHPDDTPKEAFLSTWMGTGGGVDHDDVTFAVLDESGSVVATGTGSPFEAGGRGEMLRRGDLTGAPVWRLDFSSVRTPGRYRVCVDGVGCSLPVTVGDATWSRVFTAVSRATYHQRSGIALTEPFTAIERPRVHHPDDGSVVSATGLPLGRSRNGGGTGTFADLVDAATAVEVADAWGGYMDGGDWDRQVQHLSLADAAVDLVDLYPEMFATLDVSIPESGDAIPDLLDEARWGVDIYRRLQMPDGAIRGGIESSAHPVEGSTSWTDELPLFAFAPDPYSSYTYAAAAANLARVLGDFDPVAAGEYRESALAAMAWAETQPPDDEVPQELERRTMAAAALFRLTGDDRWHQIVRDTAAFADGPIDFLDCRTGPRCDTVWIYARTDHPDVDPQLKANAVASLIANAEEVLRGAESTAFGWAIEDTRVPLVVGLGPSAPKAVGLLRAHVVSGDARFREAAVRAASFSVGANPTNLSFITGVGADSPRRPLVVDTLNGGLAAWPGTPVYGLHDLDRDANDDWFERFYLAELGAHPLPPDVPYLESFWDLGVLPAMAEFTIHQQHAPTLFVYGLLAAGG